MRMLLVLIIFIVLCSPLYAFSPKYYGNDGFHKYKKTIISCNDKKYLKIIIHSLKELEYQGYLLPPVIIANKEEYQIEELSIIDDNYKGFILGETDTVSGYIYLNPYDYKYHLKESYKTIFHEIGHYNNFENIYINNPSPHEFVKYILDSKNLPEKDIPEIKRVLGNYACTNPAEFVAEYFAHKVMGDKIFSLELTKLYYSFGGV